MKSLHDVNQLLRDYGAFREKGHFLLASENHSSEYDHVRVALAQPDCARQLAEILLNEYRAQLVDPTVVVVWTLGGRFLADALIPHFAPGTLRLVLADVQDDVVTLRDELREDDTALLVDDILTTGKTLQVIARELQRRHKGALKAVAVGKQCKSSA
jgi:orotate phosphoribosyltransferase